MIALADIGVLVVMLAEVHTPLDGEVNAVRAPVAIENSLLHMPVALLAAGVLVSYRTSTGT